LLRYLNPPWLCNGTRLVIQKLMKNVIEASILNGKFRGENILIPRIPIIPTDVPIQFKLLLFPIRLAFAISIKSNFYLNLICLWIRFEYTMFFTRTTKKNYFV